MGQGFPCVLVDYLAEATLHVSTDPWRSRGRGGKQQNPGLQRGYGGIITWQVAKEGEAPAKSREHDPTTFNRRLGFVYGGENRQHNFLVSRPDVRTRGDGTLRGGGGFPFLSFLVLACFS